MSQTLTVLVLGASGSIGRHVVAQALAEGHRVRALVRSRSTKRRSACGMI